MRHVGLQGRFGGRASVGGDADHDEVVFNYKTHHPRAL